MSSEIKSTVDADREAGLRACEELLRRDRASDLLIAEVRRLWRHFRAGISSVPWDEVEPVDAQALVDHEDIRARYGAQASQALYGQLVCICLNGGLGTSMDLDAAKSLIRARGDRTFLDVIAEQVAALRPAAGTRPALLLMNSFRTRDDSLRALSGFAQPDQLPLDFLQNRIPRLDAATGEPIGEDEQSWAPPGHGDIYLALHLSGLLDHLVELGYRWAFVSNSDNLGATVDPHLLAYLAAEQIDLALEVTPKTLADRKGGTLVHRGGRVTLLERAQVPPERLAEFEDIGRFRVFNTNNLWWSLPALRERMRHGGLALPPIINAKQLGSRRIVQLETAMGAAIGAFERTAGILVSRERFAPVKTTSDLLAVRSDAYVLDAVSGLRPNPARPGAWGPPLVRLDESYFGDLLAFEQRVAEVPSLVRCRSLMIEGDVSLGRGLVFEGDVVLRNASDKPQRVADHSLLNGPVLWR